MYIAKAFFGVLALLDVVCAVEIAGPLNGRRAAVSTTRVMTTKSTSSCTTSTLKLTTTKLTSCKPSTTSKKISTTTTCSSKSTTTRSSKTSETTKTTKTAQTSNKPSSTTKSTKATTSGTSTTPSPSTSTSTSPTCSPSSTFYLLASNVEGTIDQGRYALSSNTGDNDFVTFAPTLADATTFSINAAGQLLNNLCGIANIDVGATQETVYFSTPETIASTPAVAATCSIASGALRCADQAANVLYVCANQLQLQIGVVVPQDNGVTGPCYAITLTPVFA